MVVRELEKQEDPGSVPTPDWLKPPAAREERSPGSEIVTPSNGEAKLPFPLLIFEFKEETRLSWKLTKTLRLSPDSVATVDTSHHMLGRLASNIGQGASQWSEGDGGPIRGDLPPGGLVRQKMKNLHFLYKRMNTKPPHGPIHFRTPSKILWKTIREMIPHKTKRGATTLSRLKAYKEIPPLYDKMK